MRPYDKDKSHVRFYVNHKASAKAFENQVRYDKLLKISVNLMSEGDNITFISFDVK